MTVIGLLKWDTLSLANPVRGVEMGDKEKLFIWSNIETNSVSAFFYLLDCCHCSMSRESICLKPLSVVGKSSSAPYVNSFSTSFIGQLKGTCSFL